MENFTVYVHIAPNDKKYVGITGRRPTQRWANGKGYVKNTYLSKAIQKYGWNNFKHMIVADHLTKEEACELEKMLIASYRTTDPRYGFNNSIGGEGGSLGAKLSDEFREKARQRMLGPNNPNRGKKFSPELCRKFSEVRKGKFSERQMECLRRVHKKNSKKVICLDTGVVYDSITIAGKECGCAASGITEVCKGKWKSVKGTHWAFYNEDQKGQGQM